MDMGLHYGSVAVTNNTATSGTASGRSPVVDCTSTLTWCEHQPVRLSTGGFGCTATRVSVAAVLRWQESRLWSKRLGIAVTNSQLSVMDVQVLRCAAGTSGGLRGPRTLAGPVAAARHMARAAV